MRLALVTANAASLPFPDLPFIRPAGDGTFKLPERSEPPCSSYQHGCVCPACSDLAEQISDRGFDHQGKVKSPQDKRVKFPWELSQAA